jgi:hypothetical protein
VLQQSGGRADGRAPGLRGSDRHDVFSESHRYLAENVKHAELHGVPAEALEPLQRAYAQDGRAGMVSFVLERAGKQEGAPGIMLTVFHAEAGNLDAAFHHLQRALDSRDPALVHLAVAPQWDPLRDDPRFEACLAQMGLSPRRTAPPTTG